MKFFGKTEKKIQVLQQIQVVFQKNISEDIGKLSKTPKKFPYSTNHRYDIRDYFISIEYDNSKTIEVRGIKNDKAYKLVSILLDPYPVNNNIKIPIDIYIYKNKVYPDLHSTDFSKIENYKEALALVDNES